MTDLTTIGANLAVDAIMGAGVAAGDRYVALLDGTQTELSGSGYAQQLVDGSGAASGSDANDAVVEFTASGGSWAVEYAALKDAAGNILAQKAFSRAVADGEVVRFNVGDFTLTGAGSLTTAGKNMVVDAVFGAGVAAASRAIMLLGSDPTASGTMTSELADSNGYARQSIAGSGAAASVDDNAALVEFTASGGAWTEAAYYGMADSATYGGGVMLAYKAIATPRTLADGDTLGWDAGTLDVTGS